MTRPQMNLTRTRKVLLGSGALLAVSLCMQASAGVPPSAPNAESAAARTAMANHQGIWKWVVAPVRMNGRFDDHDPIGLVAGKLIPADCAFNWTDPDTHRLICFMTATSLEYFLASPQTYLREAQKNWLALKGKRSAAR